ncbi:hypothetical protein HMPREF9336_02044 [Segniliparus rugosus ATCC BAA-974]|uniref:Uncharacterized protein n=2 Tax=Segniliparus rugosus TaxID=286804 RepID=E5XRC2_SEGRC|nr:hypothetical protein HMPREF9336_02044 [Segniliparus rugosus ATCC BAA-974]
MPLGLVPLAWADDDDDDEDGGSPPYWNNAGPVDPDDPVVIYSDQPSVPVEYEVTGTTRSADIQFVGEGGMHRIQGFVLPFRRKALAWPPVQFMPMFATVPETNDWLIAPNGDTRRQGDSSLTGGSATCRIWVSGKLVQERTVSGVNHTARCAVTIRFFD